MRFTISGYVRSVIHVIDPTMTPELAAIMLGAKASGRPPNQSFILNLDAERAKELCDVLSSIAGSPAVSSVIGTACSDTAELLRSRSVDDWALTPEGASGDQ